jgi:hypothetical protein
VEEADRYDSAESGIGRALERRRPRRHFQKYMPTGTSALQFAWILRAVSIIMAVFGSAGINSRSFLLDQYNQYVA